jgi:hypothetical protein
VAAPLMTHAPGFAARKNGETLHVFEQLRDSTGVSSPDVSSWYWLALIAPSGSSSC